ncbi:pentapeptide repeat-containing protein [Leptothoe spongobia TAU-MAC 1115]|uniref:Pentapeptide repeat-containing protein n=1 Tax=Leptothoe spongobia TAU-MAC 1115 TaxID=1967444 RepID=A0A947GN49_9CYAN|nr:pentapeptide repeat-containing protein [Leptothoe spongobia TAU-MAC 1115]
MIAVTFFCQGFSALEMSNALGIQSNKVEAIAWVLLQRSLLQAMSDLTSDCKDSLNINKLNLKMLCEQLDLTIEKKNLPLDSDFFKNPKKIPVVEDAKNCYLLWLQSHGLQRAIAEVLANRLPRYFVFALVQQWMTNSHEYALLHDAIASPFATANEREWAWMRYSGWLQRKVDESMFGELFGLRQIYIRLRAYYKRSVKVNGSKRTERIVVDLEKNIKEWLEYAHHNDAIRVICGGPGCGKSSFSRMLAAKLTDEENEELPTLPVLFVPLYLLDLSGDLLESMRDFFQADLDNILPLNPLEKNNAEHRLLIIFDGLDELSMQGKVAAQVAKDFVSEVQRKLLAFNRQELRVFVLMTGRELTVQANKEEFRKEGQILHVLPYYRTREDLEKHIYVSESGLLEQDQRQCWWKKYGRLKSKPYNGLPDILNQREKIVEITAQPLLNYLLALSYECNTIDFLSKNDFNENEIYHSLLEQVYQRDWANYQHPTLGNIRQEEFERILEEIAIACWHGNGRTATTLQIEKRCTSGSLKKLLNVFEDGVKASITQLLTAFYFRQTGFQGSEATFEFTHKSFGEYLTARRILLEVKLIQQQLEQYRENSDIGWDEKECLKRWVMLCGPSKMDEYLFSFLCDEIRLNALDQVQRWQKTLCDLVSYMQQCSLPMEKLSPRLEKYIDEVTYSRNASESLLATLSGCALFTKEISSINWHGVSTFGNLLSTIQGQRVNHENPLVFACLNHLNLNRCNLLFRDLYMANLEGANLEGTNLEGANLQEVNLKAADLRMANLQETSLQRINLEGANLEGANLEGANLEGANLQRANLQRANLQRASLEGANLEGANLEGVYLERTKFSRANLKNTLWSKEIHRQDLIGIKSTLNIPDSTEF